MSDQQNDIEKLIRLKRYEQPREGYFDDFLTEFQSRQRSEMLHRSARSLLFERVGTYFSGFSKRQWVYAGSAAYAAVTIGFFLVSGMNGNDATPGSPTSIASAKVTPAGSALDEKHLLWDEMKIVIEDDGMSQEIANRQFQTRPAQYDLEVLPTSFRDINANLVPAKSGEDTAQEKPVAPPVGLDL